MIEHPWVDYDGTLFVLRFPAAPTVEEILGFGHATDVFYSQNESPIAWVIDGSRISLQGVRHRKALSEVLERDRSHLAEHCLAMAIVVPNPMVRGAAQAVLWLAPPGYPYAFFGDLERARDWATERLFETAGCVG